MVTSTIRQEDGGIVAGATNAELVTKENSTGMPATATAGNSLVWPRVGKIVMQIRPCTPRCPSTMAAKEESALLSALRILLDDAPNLRGQSPPFRGVPASVGVQANATKGAHAGLPSRDPDLGAAVALLHIDEFAMAYPASLVLHALSVTAAARPQFGADLVRARSAWCAPFPDKRDNLVLGALSLASSPELALELRSVVERRTASRGAAAPGDFDAWMHRAIAAALGPVLPLLAGVPVSVAAAPGSGAGAMVDAAELLGGSAGEADPTWSADAFGFGVTGGEERLTRFSAAEVADAIVGPYTALPSPEAAYAAARAYARLREESGRRCAEEETAELRRAVLVSSMRDSAQYAVLEDPVLAVPDGSSREDTVASPGVHLAVAIRRPELRAALAAGDDATSGVGLGRLLGPAEAMGLGSELGHDPMLDGDGVGEDETDDSSDSEAAGSVSGERGSEGASRPRYTRPPELERALGSYLDRRTVLRLCEAQDVCTVAMGTVTLQGETVRLCLRAGAGGQMWAWPLVPVQSSNDGSTSAWTIQSELVCLPLPLEPPRQPSAVHFVAGVALCGGPGAENKGAPVAPRVCGVADDAHTSALLAARDLTASRLESRLDPDSICFGTGPVPCRTLLSGSLERPTAGGSGSGALATPLGFASAVGVDRWLHDWCPTHVWLRVLTE